MERDGRNTHLLRHDDACKSWLGALHTQSHQIMHRTVCEAAIMMEWIKEADPMRGWVARTAQLVNIRIGIWNWTPEVMFFPFAIPPTLLFDHLSNPRFFKIASTYPINVGWIECQGKSSQAWGLLWSKPPHFVLEVELVLLLEAKGPFPHRSTFTTVFWRLETLFTVYH